MNKKYIRSLFALLMVVLGGVILPACNTVEGAGKDVKKGGEAVEDAAHDAKH